MYPIRYFSEFRRQFQWFPKTLRSTNYFYTTNKIETKWLTWAYIEGRTIPEILGERYEEYWSSEEQFIKYFRIDLNRSIREWDEFDLE